MSRRILSITFCATLFVIMNSVVDLHGQSRSPAPLLFTDCRILDVAAGQVVSRQEILIIDGRIAAIGTSVERPEEVQVIDLQGKHVLPGLIDLHSHLLLQPYDEISWNDQVLKESLELRTIKGSLAARSNLEAGFTTLRDLGTEGAGFADIALRDAIAQDLIPGPRLFVVTRALVTSGGYGPSGFDPRWKVPQGAQVADGIDGVRQATREQIAAGADWIKVYADYRRRSGDASTPTFSLDELKAIVDECRSAKIPVAAHATTDEGIQRAVIAGVTTIEHGYQASDETLALIREHNVVLCPTLAANEAILIYSGWTRNQPEPARIKTARALIRRAIAAKVTIACGSDVGVFAHGENLRELKLMHEYGMPREDALRAATSVAAQVLGQDRLGQIKTDWIADFVVVEGNPLEDLDALASPLMVIKSGRVVVDRVR